MEKFIKKLINKLEEELKLAEIDRERYFHGNATQFNYGKAVGYGNGIQTAIESAKELAQEYNPKTRADRIRNMSDEELADFMDGLMSDFDAGKEDILEYLKSELEEETENEHYMELD